MRHDIHLRDDRKAAPTDNTADVSSGDGLPKSLVRFKTAVAIFLLTAAAAAQSTQPTSAPTERFLIESPASPVGIRAMTIDGRKVEIGGRDGQRATVLCFLDVECPIARKSIPKLNALAVRAAAAKIDFFGVIADPFTSRRAAAAFAAEFAVAFPVIFDASGTVAVALQPTRVPEAFLLDSAGDVLYRGRIDDEFFDVGRPRTEITSRELSDAIDAVAAGRKPLVRRTTPIGCIFEAWTDGVLPVEPTYARDIRPIVDLSCIECHRAGAVGPFALDSLESIKKRSKTIRDVVDRRLMPPFKPTGSHRVFIDDMRLTDRERRVFLKWIEGPMTEGEPDDLPPAPSMPSASDLGPPDLLLELPEEFIVPASGPDFVQVFVLPSGLTEARPVRAVELRSSDPSVVHHALFLTDATGAGRALDRETPEPGYPRFGGVGFEPTDILGGHVPGCRPHPLPDGTAFRWEARADFILQVHYHPVGRVVRDRPRVAVWFAREPVLHRMFVLAVATLDIDIPAGESDYRRNVQLTLPVDSTLHIVTPHMHDVARSMVVSVKKPGAEPATLLRIDDWDFRHQRPYFLKRPIRLPRGTTIEVEAHYDNSDKNPRNPSRPPARVVFGDRAESEMCMAVLGITVDPSVEKSIEEATSRPSGERR